jgi:hypothetical protein
MKLRGRTKKIIAILLGSFLAVAIFVWYFFPVLMAKSYWSPCRLVRQYLASTPIAISALTTPPNDWVEISIGRLSMKLPMAEYTKVGGREWYLYFASRKGFLMVNDIVPSRQLLKLLEEKKLKYPVLSYRDRLAIFESTPTDVSFFKSRNKNITASQNLILKAIAIPVGGLGKILSINTGFLKALCILSEKHDKGYLAIADVYSQNEQVALSLIMRYKDKATLESDLLAVLGGIRMPDHMDDLDQVAKDIDRIVAQYNKT